MTTHAVERPLLSVIIPAFNEEATIAEVIRRVRATAHPKEVIVVDDASTDRTAEIVRGIIEETRATDLRLILHEVNRGKGAALRTAQSHVGGRFTLIQDADLEYDPEDYDALLAPLLDGRADVVFGSRFLGGPHRVLYFWHRVANGVLTTFSNMLTNLNLTDMETGYKVMRTDVFRAIRIVSNRFGIEVELTAKLARMRLDGRPLRIYETPISYSGRLYSEGKKITWRDGLAALWHIVRFSLSD